MRPDFARKATVPEGVLFRQLGEESILLNLNSETYFGLDEVGTRIWDLVTSGLTIQEAYEVLLNEYEVPPETLSKDIAALLEELLMKGLLVIAGE